MPIGINMTLRIPPDRPKGGSSVESCLAWDSANNNWENETQEWQCCPVWNTIDTLWENETQEWQCNALWNTTNTLWENTLNKWEQ